MATTVNVTTSIHLHDGATVTTQVKGDGAAAYATINLGSDVTIFVHDASVMQSLRSAILEVALEMSNATRISH
jgi:hypothetical protein